LSSSLGARSKRRSRSGRNARHKGDTRLVLQVGHHSRRAPPDGAPPIEA
jgi:hypothetical protein